MKAVLCRRYGPPEDLQWLEVPKPSPKDNEVLIKIYATTVTSGDSRLRSLKVPVGFRFISRLMFGVSKPRQPILGSELAGVVESIGKHVTNFKVGDSVIAFSDTTMGCHAEYKCMHESGPLVLKPTNMTYEAATALSFGGMTALDFLKRAKLQHGERVLINGASGAVGTAAVQLARHFGAEVTGVCSASNMELVRSIGASHVINYTKEDFTKNGETYDIILDTVGTVAFCHCKDSLKEGGCLVMIVAGLPDIFYALRCSIFTNKRFIAGPAATHVEDLRFIAKLAETGKYKPIIDRFYSFDQIMEAHRYVDIGHKKGNVVIIL